MFLGFKLPWCCNDENLTPEIQVPQLMVEYVRQDPQTKRIQRKITEYQSGKLDQQYADWQRRKFKTKNVSQLLKTSLDEEEKFVDSQFQHCNANISNQNQMEQEFTWARVGDIFKGAVYSTPQSLQFLQKFSFNHKALKQALTFMYRTHPHKLKYFLTKDFSPVGLYEFKFYRNGIIQNVIIDDFVPTYNKRPLFTGAVRDKEVYPMIIEKALAKVCGGYEKIPTDMDELLEILFCGPLQKRRIEDLNDKEAVEKEIDLILNKRGVGAFFSKKDGKVRNYGINESQIYHIVNKHEVYLNFKKTILYQLSSQKKLSSWNGNFSFHDEKWDKIDSRQVSQIFKDLKNNKSFCMPDGDLVHLFDHMMIFEGTQSKNKDWTENFSDTDYPSFTQFQLNQTSYVYLKIIANEEMRTSVILAKQIRNGEFSFVKSAFHSNTFSCELVELLTSGRYLVCVLHDWILNKNGPYTVFLQSSSHACLVRTPQNRYPQFLEQLFISHSKSMKIMNTLGNRYTAQRYYSTCLLAEETGFAYLHVKISDFKKKMMILKINDKILREDRWQVMQPNTGRREIQLIKNKNQEVMLIMKTTKQLSYQKVHFPTTAFSIEESA